MDFAIPLVIIFDIRISCHRLSIKDQNRSKKEQNKDYCNLIISIMERDTGLTGIHNVYPKPILSKFCTETLWTPDDALVQL